MVTAQVKLHHAAGADAAPAESGERASNATYAALERERTFSTAPDPIRSVLQHSKSHPRMLESKFFLSLFSSRLPSQSPPATNPALVLHFPRSHSPALGEKPTAIRFRLLGQCPLVIATPPRDAYARV